MDKTHTIIRFFCILGIVQMLVLGVSAADSMYRNDANRTGDYSRVAGSTGTTVSDLWNFQTGNLVVSSPSIADGTVFMGGDDYKLYALDAATGDVKWSYTAGAQVGSPAVVNGVVYAGSIDKNVYALNASTGAVKWKFRARSFTYHSSPAIAKGIVYIGSNDGDVYAINASTGRMRWNFSTGNSVESSPAVANGIVYVGSNTGYIYALNAATGAEIWHYNTGVDVHDTPVVANGIVYVVSGQKLFAFNPATGAVIWNVVPSAGEMFSGVLTSSPAVADGTVYVGGNYHKLYALSASNGAKKWNYTALEPIASSPAVANGVVYVGSDDHNMTALDAATGARLWNYQTGSWVRSSPAVVNGTVFFGSYDSRIYALNISGAPRPVVSFTASPRAGTAPLTVRFTDTTTNTPTSWKWTFGDGSAVNSTRKDPVHTYARAGTYTVTLRATNAGGSGVLTRTAYITVTGIPAITGITPAVGTRGKTVTITNLSGTNFAAGAKVFLNKTGYPLIAATSVKVVNAKKITCNFTIPVNAPLGARNVEVKNTNGKIGVKANAFTVKAAAAPAVTGITPATGKRGKYIVVTNLSGTGFVGAPKPTVQLVKSTGVITATNVTVASGRKISCTFTLPANATAGAWNVRVINGDKQAGAKASAFAVTT